MLDKTVRDLLEGLPADQTVRKLPKP